MRILAIDTSGPNCSVAVIDEQKIIASFTINIGKTHSETLLPLVDELSKFANLSINDIDVFACCVGPGSFTGIRIGIATIKGFALSLNKPVISVSTLESLTYGIPTFDGLICSVLDARNNNVYAALYEKDISPKMIGHYMTDSITDMLEEIKKQERNVLFIGDGSISYHDQIKQELSEQAVFAPHYCNEQSAIFVAIAALQKYQNNEIENADTLHPLYLKKSQAERQLENKNEV